MESRYRHTQVGWVILGVAAAVVALAWAGLPPEATAAARFPLLLGAALVLVFGALSVAVDDDAVRLRFGIGLVRKRIPLRDVKSWREVRNAWYLGWGIHMFPGGVLWNVAGFDAVELLLAGDRRLRIGTDEPANLAAAIARAKGEAMAVPAALGNGRVVEPRGGVAWRGGVIALLIGAAAIGGLFWSQIRPPVVTVGPQGFKVETLFYGTTFSAADITAISLETKLPRVRWKTNGFNGAGMLRGRFQLDELGEGRLYVELGFAPYVLVRLRQGFVTVNFREPERTRALYDALVRAWPDRAATTGP